MNRLATRAFLVFAGLTVALLAATFLQGTESRAGKRFRAIERLGGRVLAADPNRVDPDLEGKLVRLEGRATSEGVLEDPLLGVRTSGLLLARTVEMWLWLEVETDGGFEYRQGWSDALVGSAGFAEPAGHENPTEPRMPPLTATATVRVGEYLVPDNLVRTIQRREPLAVTSLDGLPETLRSQASIRDGAILLAADPDAPQVGDLRVTFEVVPPVDIKLLGRQEGRTLVHFGEEKRPRYLIMRLEDALLFPHLDGISPAQIWEMRCLSLVGLAAGLMLLRSALPSVLRPGPWVVALLAVSAAAVVGASVWAALSVVHAATFAGLTLASLSAALLASRRSADRTL